MSAAIYPWRGTAVQKYPPQDVEAAFGEAEVKVEAEAEAKTEMEAEAATGLWRHQKNFTSQF